MRNSSLVKCSCADNSTGLKSVAEAMEAQLAALGRRAFRGGRSGGGKPAVDASEERMPV